MANLEDLIDPEYGLQQDEWSLTRPKFGEHGQLEVIGWSGKGDKWRKKYILKCGVCAQDPELFGKGAFIAFKNNLLRGTIPCGCSRNTQWGQEQISVKLRRTANSNGFEFKSLVGEYVGRKSTTCIVKCPLHGEWETSIDSILCNRGCPVCRQDKLSDVLRTKGNRSGSQRYKDTVHIEEFMATGGFVEGTKFSRSLERKTTTGRSAYWSVYCPECDTTSTAFHGQLKNGQRSCECSPRRHKEAYISVLANTGIPVAIKFGIANNSLIRNQQQNRTSSYIVQSAGVWEFETKEACVAAERECKRIIECGVLTKEEMPDGYTETTWVYNLEKIIAIYEKHGGVRVDG